MVKSFDGNKDKPIQFMLNSGSNSSALEHSVPEQFISAPDNPVQGISAVKALKIASDQGIPIYTITATNINTILPQLQLDGGTIADIQNAVNAGKVVTASKTEITFNGWTGCGYIIIDPSTGAGAYMISGGMNGAILLITIAIMLLILLIFYAPVIIAALGTLSSVINTSILWLASWVSVAGYYLSQSAFFVFLGFILSIAWACLEMSPPSPPGEEEAFCVFLMTALILIINSLR
jgi:uncharacterized membrane protein YvlD (DUF360 family)